jgi:propanol-preferring alcohol dehydrogenase
MRAMVFNGVGQPLAAVDLERPEPGPGQVLLRVEACGVCRTDLHIVDGELQDPSLPLIPGHQIVGVVETVAEGIRGVAIGDRVGVPWLAHTCGECGFCSRGEENLCDGALFTGYSVNGGFAEYCVADAAACIEIPTGFSPLQAAPLLCAGLIGYRAYRMMGEADTIGFYGFGSAASILIQVAVHQRRRVYAFVRPGDETGKAFALDSGAVWAGSSDEEAPVKLDAAIIFATAGHLVVKALSDLRKGGRVVCAGIHMSDIPSFPYSLIWGERSIVSVANLTRRDGHEFIKIAAEIPVRTTVSEYQLEAANEALEDLRHGRVNGSLVLSLEAQ